MSLLVMVLTSSLVTSLPVIVLTSSACVDIHGVDMDDVSDGNDIDDDKGDVGGDVCECDKDDTYERGVGRISDEGRRVAGVGLVGCE
jgi:hypothetical protein